MLIYQFRHIPTNKVYIGALKNDARFHRYNSSSDIVKSMMKKNPEEWQKYILLSEFSPDIKWHEVVALEQSIIAATAKEIGWQNMFNKGTYKGHIVRATGKGNDKIKQYWQNISEEELEKRKKCAKKTAGVPRPNQSKRTLSDKDIETRIAQCRKNAEARKGQPSPAKETLKNSRWVTNGIESRQMKYLPEGWRYGRTILPETLDRMVRPGLEAISKLNGGNVKPKVKK